jgi:YihY family inner membrane protein
MEGVRLAVSAWKGFSAHQGTQAAAAISYWGFLSLFSLLALAAGVAGLVFHGCPDIPAKILDYVRTNLPALSDTTEEALRTTVNLGGVLGAIGLLGLLFSGTRLADSLQVWINHIWGGRRYGWIRTKSKSLVILGVVGLALALGASGHWFITSRAGGHPALGMITRVISFLLSVGVQCLGLVFLYYASPEPKPRPGYVLPGALFSAFLLNPLQLLLAWYYSRLGHLSAAYGSLAGAALLLLALYYGALVVLLGAELNLAMLRRREKEGREYPGET